MLGVQPLLGRVFLTEEQEAGKEHEVVLSYSLWQSHFAGNPEIIGRSVALSGETYTVVGVMPRDFKFAPFWATKAQLWAPLALGSRLTDRGGSSLRVFARLKPGVTLEQAQAEMAAHYRSPGARVSRHQPGHAGCFRCARKWWETFVPRCLCLLGAVGFVLLIACANVSHMLLARAAARREEIALRTALGAGRWDVFRQLLTESLALALMGGERRFAACGVGRSRSAGDRSGRHTESGNRRCGWSRAAVCTRYLFAYRPGIRHGSGLESDRGQPQRRFEGRENADPAKDCAATGCAVFWWAPNLPWRWCCWPARG